MNKRKIILPLLIVLIALIIGGGILFSRREYRQSEISSTILDAEKQINIRPISNSDHIYGNPKSDVTFIVYSDLECPSCREFYLTMMRVMNEYAKNGEVSLVYRHFPVEKSHPNSKKAAVASECVASIGGEEKFWEYLGILFNDAPNSLLPENLKASAKKIKIDEAKFDGCLILQSDNEAIKQSLEDGYNIFKADSNFGTPYTIITSRSGFQTKLIGNHALKDVLEIINLIK